MLRAVVLKQIYETGFIDVLMGDLREKSKEMIGRIIANQVTDENYNELLKIPPKKINCPECKKPDSLTYSIIIDNARSKFMPDDISTRPADRLLHSRVECFATFFIQCNSDGCLWHLELYPFEGYYKGNPVNETEKNLYIPESST